MLQLQSNTWNKILQILLLIKKGLRLPMTCKL